MSGGADESASGAEEPEEQATLFDQPEGTDWFLATFIRLADAHGIEIGMTLHLQGLILTGTLISGRTYFEELGPMLVQSTGSQQIAEAIGAGSNGFAQIYPLAEPDKEYPYKGSAYIHLRDAQIIQPPGTAVPGTGVLWRGKLSHVSGFTIGRLSIERA